MEIAKNTEQLKEELAGKVEVANSILPIDKIKRMVYTKYIQIARRFSYASTSERMGK